MIFVINNFACTSVILIFWNKGKGKTGGIFSGLPQHKVEWMWLVRKGRWPAMNVVPKIRLQNKSSESYIMTQIAHRQICQPCIESIRICLNIYLIGSLYFEL